MLSRKLIFFWKLDILNTMSFLFVKLGLSVGTLCIFKWNLKSWMKSRFPYISRFLIMPFLFTHNFLFAIMLIDIEKIQLRIRRIMRLIAHVVCAREIPWEILYIINERNVSRVRARIYPVLVHIESADEKGRRVEMERRLGRRVSAFTRCYPSRRTN